MATPKVDSAYAGTPVVQPLPTNIRESGLLSDTSQATECFINQRFSAQLQAFMVAYTNSVYSNYPIYAVWVS